MMSESVTVTVQNGSSRPAAGPAAIAMNPDYYRSAPGLIKIVQLILGILCMALGGNAWFLFVAVAAFIMTLIWCVIYFFSIRESLNVPINWILTELLNTAIWAVLYFTAFIVQLSFGIHWGAFIAAAIFGALNTLAYAAGAYFLYLEYKN